MANNPPTCSVVEYTGTGNVQVYPLLPTQLLGTQDGSDVGTGGPALATLEVTPLGSFPTNRVIEFHNDRYCLTQDAALTTSGVYKRNQPTAGQWGRVQGGSWAPSIDGACSGLHVLHPNGVPTLAFISFNNANELYLYSTTDGTSGSYWGSGYLLLETNSSQPVANGASCVFRDSIFWSHKSFTGGAGTGTVTQYDLKLNILTRHQPAGIGTGTNFWPSQIAFHVQDNKLFCTGYKNSTGAWTLWRFDAGSFVEIYSESDQGGTDWNWVWTVQIGHTGIFTDLTTGDLICVISGARKTDNVARCRILRFQNATGSPTRTYLDTADIGSAFTGKYFLGGTDIDFNMKWIVQVDTETDPDNPRTFIAARKNSATTTETWEWTGVSTDLELVSSGNGILNNYAWPRNTIGGGERSPRSAAVELGDTANPPTEVIGGTKLFFRAYGSAAAGTVTFRGTDTEETPTTIIPIIASSLTIESGSPPTTPAISGNTLTNFTPDNGVALYSVILDVGFTGVDIAEGDVGLIIVDFV
jgi:hypothetical protein